MWYFNKEIIKTPKTMSINNVVYPKTIFKDNAMLTSLGIKPYKETTPDARYYWNGAYTVDASGDEVVGTYASTPKDLNTLKTNMLDKAKSTVASKLAEIDWYWARESKGGTAVPSNIQTYATTLYSEHETIKTAINDISDLAGVIAYENKPHTETRKIAIYNEDGSFKEYDGTETFARKIDMCTHYTNNPNIVDEGFVSLVAD